MNPWLSWEISTDRPAHRCDGGDGDGGGQSQSQDHDDTNPWDEPVERFFVEGLLRHHDNRGSDAPL